MYILEHGLFLLVVSHELGSLSVPSRESQAVPGQEGCGDAVSSECRTRRPVPRMMTWALLTWSRWCLPGFPIIKLLHFLFEFNMHLLGKMLYFIKLLLSSLSDNRWFYPNAFYSDVCQIVIPNSTVTCPFISLHSIVGKNSIPFIHSFTHLYHYGLTDK